MGLNPLSLLLIFIVIWIYHAMLSKYIQIGKSSNSNSFNLEKYNY